MNLQLTSANWENRWTPPAWIQSQELLLWSEYTNHHTTALPVHTCMMHDMFFIHTEQVLLKHTTTRHLYILHFFRTSEVLRRYFQCCRLGLLSVFCLWFFNYTAYCRNCGHTWFLANPLAKPHPLNVDENACAQLLKLECCIFYQYRFWRVTNKIS